MYVADLALTDYRSYEQAVSFPPGATVLVGSNGQGKTNLVESINYLATLSSHRVGADTALVRRDASGQNQPNAAVIRAKLITAARPQLLEVEIILEVLTLYISLEISVFSSYNYFRQS